MLTGEILRAARALARLEQAQLADAAGVSLETVKRLERVRGAINANVRTISALTAALRRFNITIEQNGDGSIGIVWRAAETPPVTLPAPNQPEPASLHRIIYHSRTTARHEDDVKQVLDRILPAACRRNSELGVSGALVAANGRFLQVLEGDRNAVMQVYGAIASDPRHHDLTIVESKAIPTRLFPSWVMCVRASSPDELAKVDASQAGGLAPERLSPAACLGLLSSMVELEAEALEQETAAVPA